MRQKELRIALVCYGGVSLAVYMHGVTKEIWKLARASRALHSSQTFASGVEQVYHELLETIERGQQLRLRVLPDILTGASAGGINAVFLAQAVHSGQSLDPLTDLWLERSDVERLIDPDARPWSRVAKWWAWPFIQWLLTRPGNVVSESVAPETRAEVRRKVSNFIRSRWFEPPFSGLGFSCLLRDALKAMADAPHDAPLLPPGHPLDLLVTATDYHGYREMLRLHSPPMVEESEHRMAIGFRSNTPATPGSPIAATPELVFAARATASFPGAFPPLQVGEIDMLAAQDDAGWPGRDQFLKRIMPSHVQQETAEQVSLIDGSVLVNAPFDSAIDALRGRPAQREVDRRFVYIDPHPDRFAASGNNRAKVGFFAAILGSISAIPREQPIRDNLEVLQAQSREADRLGAITMALRPEVERTVEKLFGRTLFLDRPTPARLIAWRSKAQQAAAEQAGYAFHSYAQSKFAGIIERLSALIFEAAPELGLDDDSLIVARLREELSQRGLENLAAASGGATDQAIAFFRSHDIGFRIRRLRLLARRLARDWEHDPEIDDAVLETAKGAIYDVLALYFDRDSFDALGEEFPQFARNVLTEPGALLDYLAERRLLPETDDVAEAMLAKALEAMPRSLRRRMLFAYLGFPFYDVATLPLIRHEGFTEFDPVKVDRISPDDAISIREGGTRATLRGTEFYNFGAFFSRAYRENDYLWGRLHGAERMIDLICSTGEEHMPLDRCMAFKRRAFLAILDEEQGRLKADPGLVERVRQEVNERLA